MPAVTRLLLVFASLLFGPRVVMADELPKDPNKIESLTPEQAKRLAETFPGVDVTNKWDGITYGNCLPLNSLTKLDADLAQALAGYGKGPLLLSGLTTLDTETAAAIAGFMGNSLYLDGVSKLDIETTKAISKFKGRQLSLSGLTTLNADTARAIAQFKGKRLCVNGLTSLDAEAATALVAFKGDDLHLNGLTMLDAATAKALAGFKGTFDDELFLDGLRTLNADTAKALAEFKGQRLHLKGLTTLDADTAKALARFSGTTLYLMGLTTLDADTAEALAEFSGDCVFPYILVQQFIAEHPFGKETALLHAALLRGVVSFATLDRDTAKVIAEFKGVRLHIHGLTTLGTVAAKELAEFKGEEMVFHDLTSLDAETAKALAAYSGSLQIPNHVVEEFITKCPINKDMALAYVALLRGSLWTLTTLDADTAKALAAVEKWDGHLPRLTALNAPDSVAVAQALATRKGPLTLPNLKKLSPKTLAALIQKEDVEIPLIETLELIPEPDGSATEDFVIPEWLEERQRRKRRQQAAREAE